MAKTGEEQHINSLEDAPDALKHREVMLAAINEMAAKLLSHERESLEEVMSAETLYKKVWGQPMAKSKNALQVTIARLRKKIEPAGYSIITIRGKGYVFEKE